MFLFYFKVKKYFKFQFFRNKLIRKLLVMITIDDSDFLKNIMNQPFNYLDK